MYYGMGESDGLSDLAAFEMGQMGQGQMGLGPAESYSTAPGPTLPPQSQPSVWTPDAFAKIGKGIEDIAKVYAQSKQTRDLMKYGPRMPVSQQPMPDGAQPTQPMTTGMKTALVVGGIALGGLALWYFIKKRPQAANARSREDGWHTIGD